MRLSTVSLSVTALACLATAGCNPLVKIFDVTETVSGTSQKVGGFSAPAFDGTNVIFAGILADFSTGVVVEAQASGQNLTATAVAVDGNAAPGSDGATFAYTTYSFYADIDGGKLTFFNYLSNDADGIFSTVPGTLTRVVDITSTPPTGNAYQSLRRPAAKSPTPLKAPDAATLKSRFQKPAANAYTYIDWFTSISNGQIVFDANVSGLPDPFMGYPNFIGKVSSGGAVSKVVDTNSTIPGQGSTLFGEVFGAKIDGNNVAFYGVDAGDTTFGLYISNNGTLGKLVEDGDTAPGGLTFVSIGDYGFAGTDVFFVGYLSDGATAGIYHVSTSGGTPTKVVDTATPSPGGSTFYPYFISPQPIAGTTDCAFTAADQGGNPNLYFGVYRSVGSNKAAKVVGPGDQFDTQNNGPLVEAAYLGGAGVNGTKAALSVAFGSDMYYTTIYQADLKQFISTSSVVTDFIVRNRNWKPGTSLKF